MSLEANLNACLEIDGALAVALVDTASGMALATAGNPRGIDLNVAAAGNTNVMKAKEKTMKDLGLKDKIEDVLITLTSQYHLIRPLTDASGKGLFIYLVLDKEKANLAMARFKLASIEKAVSV
ncbi:roadblock/LC7 domain-containing protein [Novosphingobium sp.]|uniref:roadblock/LC7 domain-containing protein n=1 Tax=Novosphingobium sp. TaxID=1874826 RepID=UPI0035B4B948